ncbi:MAG: cellulase family glycosylhydrolase [Bilifractor sp.]
MDNKRKKCDIGIRLMKMALLWALIVLIFLLTRTAVYAEFQDVSGFSEYHQAVNWAQNKKIVSDTSVRRFSPDKLCTRGQIITYLWRVMGSPKAEGKNPFADVRKGSGYYYAVLWASEHKIAQGVDRSHYSPDRPCTRGEAVTFINRAVNGSSGAESGSASVFRDVPASADCYASVGWAVDHKIASGTSSTTFSPNRVCSKAEVITFLYRYFSVKGNAGTRKALIDNSAAVSGKLTVELKEVNRWQSDGLTYCQYTLTLNNKTNQDIQGWKIMMNFGTTINLQDSWNGSCQAGDPLSSCLKISNADYNGTITANGSTGDIGFILAFQHGMPDISGSYIVDGNSGSLSRINASDTSSDSPGSHESGSSNNSGNAVTPDNSPVAERGTPLASHGALSVQGRDIVDQNGKKFQLKGVSTHGLAWYPDYVNENAFQYLRDNWGANLIRLAMYTDENGGYCSGGNQADLEALIDKGVNAATDLGMYVIIDWHVLNDQTPLRHQSQAESFFEKMSAKYKNHDNVLYEICNEPNGSTTWSDVKKYAEDIIPRIRANDADALILVGTPTWSQDIDKAAADPLTGVQNVLYTFHFYAATHKDDLRNKLTNALNSGVPVFISEFSTCEASGNGNLDYSSADAWKKLIQDYNLSYAGWSLSNKDESSAILRSSCTGTDGGWTDADLSETGKYLKAMIQEK